MHQEAPLQEIAEKPARCGLADRLAVAGAAAAGEAAAGEAAARPAVRTAVIAREAAIGRRVMTDRTACMALTTVRPQALRRVRVDQRRRDPDSSLRTLSWI